MSAYAMFPGELLPILKVCNELSHDKQLYCDTMKKGDDSYSPPSSSEVQTCSMHEKESAMSRSNDVGITVTTASLDKKKFIAASSSNLSKSNSSGSIDQWEAVEYELSIKFNGETYKTNKSFPRIVQLRNDLVREVQMRRNRYPGHFGVIRSFMTHPSVDDGGKNNKCNDEDNDSVIPELPEGLCNDDSSDDGSTGSRSLNMIQSSAIGDCPRIESWLKSVSSLVNPHTSPTLTDFLSERKELSEPQVMPRLFPRARRFLRNRRRSRNSCSSLSSICEETEVDVFSMKEISIETYESDTEAKNNDENFMDDEDDEDSFSECDAFQ